MTIQTLTSKPDGLPDAGELARLANAFFSSLPGQTPQDSGTLTPPSSAAQPAIQPLPAAAPATPAGGGLRDPAAYAVPQGYAANVPQFAAAQPSAPTAGGAPASSPYYFVSEGGRYGELAGSTPAAPLPGVDDRVTAQSFGLPGEDVLRALLAGDSRQQLATPAPAATAASGQFYFLEPAAKLDKAPDFDRHVASRQHGFDVNAIRRDFPILAERVNGKPLIWLDNAATTHKPQAVIDRIAYFYQHENSNIHRAAHELAARATDAYEAARNKVARFIGAATPEEIIFVRGATEAINLVANTWGRQNIGAGDEIIVSNLEHHANIVPWQQLAASVGARIRVIPVDDSGQILLDEYRQLLNSRTKLVAITQVSNALGTVTPVAEIVALAHAAGAKALVDGAQSVSHLRVNVQALDADFFVFSGHKVFAPTGIGVVYGKAALLEAMPPWQGGGNMIADVTFEKTLYQPAPNKFEAGTGNIADAVGLGAAIDYVERIGLDNIARYEHDLLVYATHGLQSVPGLRLIGTAEHKASVLSFVLPGYRTEEIGRALNQQGIAVRSGHHCAQPILRRFGLEATVRPSLAFYNTCEEIDTLVAVVQQLAKR
ncbi:family 2A encapsulin nanocompartment cargo protein cysteine desulfurase [Vogesella indigofera]|uniref:family 2A encapsulin nanocompartment cargo protein cysteine desulfurase n=1 Tax=Vogesella indigofera TaxID=45465 RepID=UPI00234E3FD6|nr:family 2A encapsulin nanocompartment cargo protein cysteine desulfurase [Vogesella indigofera]MDC7701592.1 family 2A encapsulin nanocompartment cargo protein cysteine desulfurase [Vogesella indigofera]